MLKTYLSLVNRNGAWSGRAFQSKIGQQTSEYRHLSTYTINFSNIMALDYLDLLPHISYDHCLSSIHRHHFLF